MKLSGLFFKFLHVYVCVFPGKGLGRGPWKTTPSLRFANLKWLQCPTSSFIFLCHHYMLHSRTLTVNRRWRHPGKSIWFISQVRVEFLKISPWLIKIWQSNVRSGREGRVEEAVERKKVREREREKVRETEGGSAGEKRRGNCSHPFFLPQNFPVFSSSSSCSSFLNSPPLRSFFLLHFFPSFSSTSFLLSPPLLSFFLLHFFPSFSSHSTSFYPSNNSSTSFALLSLPPF